MADAVKAAWDKLHGLPKPGLAELFSSDPQRVERLSARIDLAEDGILFDWSKTHLDRPHLAAFEELAQAADFAGARQALLSGAIVNPTEGRAAEHTAERGMGDADSVELANMLHARMASLVEAGEVVDHQDIHEARQRHAASRAELPRAATQLSRGEAVIPTIFEEP